MKDIDWQHIDRLAKQWVKEAGGILKESLYRKIKVESKSNQDDLVTEMDRRVEQYFIMKIKETFPEHLFLGEEGIMGEEISSESGTIWIIDPIDGTTNFVHQQYNFAISVAVYHDGIGMIGIIYDVMSDELFHAIRGNGAFLNDQSLDKLQSVPVEKAILGLNAGWIVDNEINEKNMFVPLVRSVRATRSYGSAAIEIAFVSAGRLDGYISLGLSPWDFAAGLVILHEVGGIASTIDGNPLQLLEKNTLFVGKPGFHEEVISKYIKRG
ncbi:inositol monophosphatase family protein [Anaerobacillus sp. MEB173]|uniref:inositol monophosphatase family protein n=1 Tax=Anaerobacillus sp. MEB173 TaxID=3383345 RepID=UPI003F8E13B0